MINRPNDDSLDIFIKNVLSPTPPEGFNLVDEAASLLEQNETNDNIARWKKGIIGALIITRANGDETPMYQAANQAGIDGKTLYEYSLIVRFYGIPYIMEVLYDLIAGQGRKVWYTVYREVYQKFKAAENGQKQALEMISRCEGLSVPEARQIIGGGTVTTRKTVFQHSARVIAVNTNTGYVTLWVGEAVNRLAIGDEFNVKAWKEQAKETDDEISNSSNAQILAGNNRHGEETLNE